MSDLDISWSHYHQTIEYLAAKIYQSQWEFNQIVCLARGGVRVGDILSRIFSKPLAIQATSSYGGIKGKKRGNIKMAKNFTMITDSLGSHILLVDDFSFVLFTWYTEAADVHRALDICFSCFLYFARRF